MTVQKDLSIQKNIPEKQPNIQDKRQAVLEKMDALTRTYCEATGTTIEESAIYLDEHIQIALPNSTDDLYAGAASRNILKEIAPKDPLEGMLSIQMLALHNHAIDQFGASKNARTPQLEQAHLKAAMAISSLFGKQLERLNSYRKKGNQTIQVQHVNVNAGGQAVVGNVLKNDGGGI